MHRVFNMIKPNRCTVPFCIVVVWSERKHMSVLRLPASSLQMAKDGVFAKLCTAHGAICVCVCKLLLRKHRVVCWASGQGDGTAIKTHRRIYFTNNWHKTHKSIVPQWQRHSSSSLSTGKWVTQILCLHFSPSINVSAIASNAIGIIFFTLNVIRLWSI